MVCGYERRRVQEIAVVIVGDVVVAGVVVEIEVVVQELLLLVVQFALVRAVEGVWRRQSVLANNAVWLEGRIHCWYYR